MSPLAFPDGTRTISDVGLALAIVARMPLNVTTGDVAKFVPVIVTLLPTTPESGDTDAIVGGGDVTAMVTVVGAETKPSESITVYENVSAPVKPVVGVYLKAPVKSGSRVPWV